MNVNDIIELSMHPMLHVDFYEDIYLHPVECSSSNAVNTWERIYLQCLLPAMSSSSQTCSGDDDDVLMIVIIGMMYLQIIKIMMRIGPFTFNIIV